MIFFNFDIVLLPFLIVVVFGNSLNFQTKIVSHCIKLFEITQTFDNCLTGIRCTIHWKHPRRLLMIAATDKWIKLYDIRARMYLLADGITNDVGGNLFIISLCRANKQVMQNTWSINFSNDFVITAGTMVINANANSGHTSDNQWVLRLMIK